MQTQQTITLFGTVSNPATSRTSRTVASTPPLGFPSSPTGTCKPSTTTSLPGASRAISPSLSRKAPASSSSFKRSLSSTTSPRSHYSPQPSCDRFIRSHQGNTGIAIGF